MFWWKKDLLEKAQERHIELMGEITGKDKIITMLRGESGIAREAVQRFCPPELFASAQKWLTEQGI